MRRFALGALAVAAGLLAACEPAAPPPPPEPSEAPAAAESAARTGTIRGRLTYPSDLLPADLQVCARETTMAKVLCDSRREGNNGYSLVVPPGAYEVWAQTREWPPVRAFYSEFIRCGGTIECTDHTPIVVTVTAGEDSSGVDPGDWYAQLQ